jgi:hypothetical protein
MRSGKPTHYLDVFSEGAEDLGGYHDGATEVLCAGLVDDLLVAVVPVEVHDGLLQSQQVVHRADDQVDGGRVARLRSQVVLEVCTTNEDKEFISIQVVLKVWLQVMRENFWSRQT